MFSEIIVEMRTDLHAGPIIPLFLLSRKDDSERELEKKISSRLSNCLGEQKTMKRFVVYFFESISIIEKILYDRHYFAVHLINRNL